MALRGRWMGVVAVGLVLAAVACGEQSRVDPNATITIDGTARAPDGTPLRDRPVHLGAGISDGEVGLAILTVGLSCATGACRGKQLDTRTGADGSYQLTLKGSDTRSTFGEAVSELVTAVGAPGPGQVSGAAVSARFKVQTEQVHLPALQLVDPGLTVERDGGALRASWSTPAPGPHDLTFEDGRAAPVWELDGATAPVDVDARVLEDTRGRAVVAGSSTDRIEGSDVSLRWRSPGVGYAGVGHAPPSRGARCRYVTDGTAEPGPSSCPFTDGDLATAVAASVCPPSGSAASTPASTACTPATAVDVELPSPVPAELVVVRGCAASCEVAVTSDGTAYRPVGTAAAPDATVALDGTPITGVRVAVGASGGPTLRELSVWGPAPAPPAAVDEGEVRDRFDGTADDGGVPRWLAVGAALLAGAVLVAIAFSLGRRSRGRAAPAR